MDDSGNTRGVLARPGEGEGMNRNDFYRDLLVQVQWLADTYQRPAYLITTSDGSVMLTATMPDITDGLEITTVYPTLKEVDDVKEKALH